LAENSRFIVIGLGRFGGTLAERLAKQGHKVTGLDISEEAVGRLEESLDEALVADATDRDVLAATELDKADAVFIAMGDEPLRNIITAMHVVELGATKIVARGTDKVHARILEKLGDIDVVLPEQDMGAYVADAIGGPLGPGTNSHASDNNGETGK
jgi:trk system potassium uptake protein TrkA